MRSLGLLCSAAAAYWAASLRARSSWVVACAGRWTVRRVVQACKRSLGARGRWTMHRLSSVARALTHTHTLEHLRGDAAKVQLLRHAEKVNDAVQSGGSVVDVAGGQYRLQHRVCVVAWSVEAQWRVGAQALCYIHHVRRQRPLATAALASGARYARHAHTRAPALPSCGFCTNVTASARVASATCIVASATSAA